VSATILSQAVPQAVVEIIVESQALRSRRRKDQRCHVAREATLGVAKRDDTTHRDTSLHAAAQSVANRVSATILSQAVPQAVVEIIVECLAGPPATRTVKKVQVSTREWIERRSLPTSSWYPIKATTLTEPGMCRPQFSPQLELTLIRLFAPCTSS
jgi:hypothetical protein